MAAEAEHAGSIVAGVLQQYGKSAEVTVIVPGRDVSLQLLNQLRGITVGVGVFEFINVLAPVMCIQCSNIQLLSKEVMQILICGGRLHITVVGKHGDFLYGRLIQAEGLSALFQSGVEVIAVIFLEQDAAVFNCAGVKVARNLGK